MLSSEYQLRATAKYRAKQPEEVRKYNSAKTTGHTFARRYATREDMIELMKIFETENKNARD